MQKPRWVVVGDRLTAVEAAKKYGLHVKALTAAIDAGSVPGAERIETGGRAIRYLDPGELERHLAGLPRCAFVSRGGVACDRPVSLKPGSVACSGPHARGLETHGKSWRTPEAVAKSAAGIRGRPRPDVALRVAAMHADAKQRYEWGVALAEGRGLGPNAKRRWKGRLGGLEAARAAGRVGGRLPLESRDPEKAQAILRLTSEGRSIRAIARITQTSKSEVEGVLARSNKVSG
jgi:hypothetical protein